MNDIILAQAAETVTRYNGLGTIGYGIATIGPGIGVAMVFAAVTIACGLLMVVADRYLRGEEA